MDELNLSVEKTFYFEIYRCFKQFGHCNRIHFSPSFFFLNISS